MMKNSGRPPRCEPWSVKEVKDLADRVKTSRGRLIESELKHDGRAWRLWAACVEQTAGWGRLADKTYTVTLAKSAGMDRTRAGKLLRRFDELGVFAWSQARRGSRDISELALPGPPETPDTLQHMLHVDDDEPSDMQQHMLHVDPVDPPHATAGVALQYNEQRPIGLSPKSLSPKSLSGLCSKTLGLCGAVDQVDEGIERSGTSSRTGTSEGSGTPESSGTPEGSAPPDDWGAVRARLDEVTRPSGAPKGSGASLGRARADTDVSGIEAKFLEAFERNRSRR